MAAKAYNYKLWITSFWITKEVFCRGPTEYLERLDWTEDLEKLDLGALQYVNVMLTYLMIYLIIL